MSPWPEPASTSRPNPAVVAGLRISRSSFGWTLVVGSLSLGLGLADRGLTLASFGLIGLLDAAGSATLVVHFRHTLRHQRMSARHENLALQVITAGMVALGIGTAGESIRRFAGHGRAEGIPLGVVVAAGSMVVLTVLATRKRSIAPRIPSHALRADGWLSGLGAVLSLVTLVGTGLEATLGWWWVDPAAALGVASGALAMGVVLRRGRS